MTFHRSIFVFPTISRFFFLSFFLLFTPVSFVWAQASQNTGEFEPIFLRATDLSLATGNPSVQQMSNGSTYVPVWSLSGGTPGQSVSGIVSGLPDGCAAVQVEIVVTTNETQPDVTPEEQANLEDVYRVHLSQMPADGAFPMNYSLGTPVRTPIPSEPFTSRTIMLESWYAVNPKLPLVVRIQREPLDPANSFTRPMGLVLVKITPLKPLEETFVVQDVPGYNSWPVIQALGNKLVCVYSRGSAHSIGEGKRGVFAKTSEDEGKTWSPETLVADSPDWGEVTIGKGLDENGAMLVWIRRCGKGIQHDLYRTNDGVNYELISTPPLEVMPMQITDVISVPTVGLVAYWFEGNYGDDGPCHRWGNVVSTDNGKTWTQTVLGELLPKKSWPTEPSAVYLGDGKILIVARTEMGGNTTDRCQLQMTSVDYGKNWTLAQTNIGEVSASTPSLILDPETGWLYNYYYQRGRGILRRRTVKPDAIFEKPLQWPDSEAVALGSDLTYHAGNVNATAIGKKHFCAFYSGNEKQTAVVVAVIQTE